MRTRTPLLISLFALLAASSAVLFAAQSPAPLPAAQPEAPAATSAAAAKLADKPAAPEVAVKEEAAAAAATAAVATKGKDAAGRDTLSVDFPDEDVRNILRNVADLFELNLAMPDALQGKTTIKLRDVTWRQIFQTVLTPLNYTYTEEANIIKIVSNESLTQEPVSTEVFLINYAKAADILPTINSLVVPPAGKIIVDTRSNALVITERPSQMSRIRPIIEVLDKATDQVMIESKFVEVTNSDVKNIGLNWSSLANYKVGVGSMSSSLTRDRGQTGSSSSNGSQGTTSNGTNGTTATTQNQTTATQTSGATNDGKITSNNGVNTSTNSSGTNNALNNQTTNTNTSGTNNAVTDGVNNAFNLLNSIANTEATSRAMSAVFSANDFSLVLSALQSQQKSKIVSNPTIVTLNNTEAMINVGTERPLPRYTFNAQTGTLELAGFDFKPIGIILKVTPQVNARGFIKLTVEPEVSQSTRDVDMKGIPVPVIDTRKAKTQVSLKDGFTMGIGGLMQASTTKGGNQVPVLGSIPLLGRLFRSDSKNLEQTNLIIFITAKTISAEGGALEQVFESSRVRQLEMKREDMPGYRDGSTPYVTEPVEPVKKSFFRSAAPEGSK